MAFTKVTSTLADTLNQNTTGNAATATALATARTIGGTSFDGTGNIAVATATEATNVTVSANNSTDETVYPAFVDGATGTQGIETDTGLTYNPSTGDLTTAGQLGGATLNLSGNATVGGNLTVTGTTTTVNTVTMNAQNAVVFEGSTADNYETTLSIVDPTADHTQYLINQGGYIPVLAASTTTAITATPAELNYVDGVTSAIQTQLNAKAAIASPTFTGTVTTPDLEITGGSQIGQDYTYLKSNSTSYSSLTLRKDASGADSIDFLQLRNNANSLIGKITGPGVAHFTGAEITGTTNITGGLNVNSAHINVDAGMSFQWGDSHERIEQSDGHLEFFVNNGEAMTLDTNGLGLGTTDAAAPLHIKETGSTSAVHEFIRAENHALGGTGAGSSINFHHYHAGGGPSGGAKAASITAQNMASWPAGTPSSYSSGLTFGTLHENTFAERMRISSGGNLYVGQTASSGIRGIDSKVQVSGTDLATSSLALHRYQAGAYGPAIHFGKSRHGTVGSHTIVQNGDWLGFLAFYGSDGDDFVNNAAQIICQVDGTPGSNDTPGMLSFGTTADGASSATTRMVIKSDGNIGIGQTSPDTKLHIGDGASTYVRIENASSGDVSSGYQIYRGASTLGASLYDNPADNATTLLMAGKFNLATGGSGTDFHVSTGGSVGIGTTSPSGKLHLYTSGSEGINYALQNSERYWKMQTDGGYLTFNDVSAGDLARMVLSPSGANVGIGTTDFTSMGSSSYSGLKVGGGFIQDSGGGTGGSLFIGQNAYVGGSNDFKFDSGGTASSIQFSSGDINFYTFDGGGGSADATWSPTARMHIKENGNIGIRTTSPGATFDIGGGDFADPTLLIHSAAGGDPHLDFDTSAVNRSAIIRFRDQGSLIGFIKYEHNGDKLNFGSGSSTATTMTVNDGKVGINNSSPTGRLYVNGQGLGSGDVSTVRHGSDGSGNVGQILFRDNSGDYCGQITSNGSANTTIFNTGSSDERLKTDIENWNETVLPYFKTIQPKKFRYISADQESELIKGYIAQNEVGNFPEAFPKDTSENEYYNFNPSGMVPYIMKALQEQIAINEDLTARIEALEG